MLTSAEPSSSWPPPDPDRIPKQRIYPSQNAAFMYGRGVATAQDEIAAFYYRQQQDLKRFNKESSPVRQRPFRERHIIAGQQQAHLPTNKAGNEDSGSGEEAWRDSEGDRLDDFGVDEDIDFYDEDDIPLAELLRERQAKTAPSSGFRR